MQFLRDQVRIHRLVAGSHSNLQTSCSYECIRSLIQHSLAGTLWESLVMCVLTIWLTTRVPKLSKECTARTSPLRHIKPILLKLFDAHLHSPARDGFERFHVHPTGGGSTGRASATLSPASLGMDNSDAESSPNRPLSNAPDVKLAPLLNALVLAAGCSFHADLERDKRETASPMYSQRFKGRVVAD
jgi:hypothetical protein